MITILMAAYQGQAYIAEQIDSILSQTYFNWQLVIQDDCSTDDTYAIVQTYAARDNRIVPIRREQPSGGAMNNFNSLLSMAEGEYCMFCDQDDVWMPDKIERTLNKMRDMEMLYGVKTPILVHSDLTVVDEKLNMQSESLLHMLDLDARRDRFHQLLAQNMVTGCTIMVNASLLNLVERIPEHAVMHDWWFALSASAFGKIGFIHEPTVLYRQHGTNEIGAKNIRSIVYKLKLSLNAKQIKRSLNDAYTQAFIFERFYELSLPPDLLKKTKIFSAIPLLKKINRWGVLFRYGFWKKGFFRKCAQLWFV